MKAKKITALLAASVVMGGSVHASLFLDDFSTDTSANYTGSTTWGSGSGAFDVSGGTLNVDGTPDTTAVVMHNTAQLEVGETVSVVSKASNSADLYLTISTSLTGPNASGSGMRFNWKSTGDFRARLYAGGNVEAGTDVVATGTDLTLYISRVTDTTYKVGYDNGSGIVVLANQDDGTDIFTVAGTAGVAGLNIGVEEWDSVSSLDNLQITAGVIPEPATLGLVGIAGVYRSVPVASTLVGGLRRVPDDRSLQRMSANRVASRPVSDESSVRIGHLAGSGEKLNAASAGYSVILQVRPRPVP